MFTGLGDEKVTMKGIKKKQERQLIKNKDGLPKTM